ncbi:unnamed protein product, partial [Closterium sp. NIES-54]
MTCRQLVRYHCRARAPRQLLKGGASTAAGSSAAAAARRGRAATVAAAGWGRAATAAAAGRCMAATASAAGRGRAATAAAAGRGGGGGGGKGGRSKVGRGVGGSGDGGGGGSGGGGGRPSSRCGAVRWGASGGGQHCQRESLTPQQLREWCTSRGGGGGNSGSHSAAVQLGVPGGGLTHLQRRPRETLTPQQLCEWYVQRGASPSSTRCPYVICTGVAAAALGASASGTPPGTAPAEALHSFTLDSGASRCFFRNSTTLTPLLAPVPVRLADPSGGPVVANSYTVLPCPAVPSGSLSGLHLPSFSTNLVSTAALQDAMVTTTTPGGQRVSICTCTRTGRHLATFTRWRGSSLYTLATEPPQVATSAQMSA